MSDPGEQHNPAEGIAIRPFDPATDRAQVDRLIHEGVLPGHVDYESTHADAIGGSLGSPRERFFVAEAPDGRIIGTLAVVEASPGVAHLHWLRVDPAWQGDLVVRRLLVRAAAAHARDVGLLKLAMHCPSDVAQRVAAYYHQLGFEFSRARELEGVHVMEFYLNLYERPPILRDE